MDNDLRLSTRAGVRFAGAAQVALMLVLIAVSGAGSQASGASQQAVNRADALLRTEERGKEILSYVHFGAAYRGHRYVRTLAVDDGTGAFALVYRFQWEADGVTDLAFLCDSGGNVYRVRVEATNAEATPPFLWANVSIAAFGHGLIELYKDRISENDREQLHDLVRKADARGLLELSLRLRQIVQ